MTDTSASCLQATRPHFRKNDSGWSDLHRTREAEDETSLSQQTRGPFNPRVGPAAHVSHTLATNSSNFLNSWPPKSNPKANPGTTPHWVSQHTFRSPVVATLVRARRIEGGRVDFIMIPCHYSECVSVAEVPAHDQESCTSFCDVESVNRCKTGVIFGPGLAPTSYRDAIIVYLDSTRKRYISRVDYTTRMKPKSYSETNFMRPKHVSTSFVAFLEHHSDQTRRWYKTSVQLKPKLFTSSHTVPILDSKKVSEVGGINQDYSRHDSVGDPLSPIQADPQGQRGDSADLWKKRNGFHHPIEQRSTRIPSSDVKGNREGHTYNKESTDSNANKITMHRSGPFIYNAPKERHRLYKNMSEMADYLGPRQGPLRLPGRDPAIYTSALAHNNGYGHGVDDL